MLKKIALFAGSFFVFVTGAFAADAPLTADAAKRFVASLDSVKTLADEFEASGKTEALELDAMPKAGEPFKPYSKSIAALKDQYPADYTKLQSAVKPHGFNAEEWGSVGDRVMVAYLARKMEKENPDAMAQMAQMDPNMLNMMPPEMKAQVMQAKAMLDAVAAAPAEDKAVVAEVEGDLDAFMEEEAAEHSGHH
ncbi:MAG: hypothetical protein KAH44_28715 [Oricola sp.]|jgi:hypothetical protein|nr:hypothetical protein [Oricola sp.]